MSGTGGGHGLNQSDLATVVRTLVLTGFEMRDVRRTDHNCIIRASRYDPFGAQIHYALLIDDTPTRDTLEPFLNAARASEAVPVGIGPWKHDTIPVVTLADFYRHLGGAVTEDIVYREDLRDVLHALGHNRLPDGETGEPQDLLEEYVKQCVQFLTGQRSLRYGQDRLFESVPDGIALGDAVLLLDSKAYSDGYDISADDVKRFTKYVTDFNTRYEQQIGPIFSFCVVTGTFKRGAASLENRREELYAACRTQLSCMTALTLGEMVELTLGSVPARRSVDWRRLFARLEIKSAALEAEFARVKKDGI